MTAGWDVAAASVEFLPVGDDARAWSFRVVTGDGGRRFLKVRRGPVDPAAVVVLRFLRDHGRTQLVTALAATVARESFVPWGARPVRALDRQIGRARPDDPLGGELDGGWRAHRDEIRFAADRAERLGRVVAAARPRLVLCHADLHTANLLVDAGDRLFVVDWDGVQFAPPERDLLLVAIGEERARFFDGTGTSRWTRRS